MAIYDIKVSFNCSPVVYSFQCKLNLIKFYLPSGKQYDHSVDEPASFTFVAHHVLSAAIPSDVHWLYVFPMYINGNTQQVPFSVLTHTVFSIKKWVNVEMKTLLKLFQRRKLK